MTKMDAQTRYIKYTVLLGDMGREGREVFSAHFYMLENGYFNFYKKTFWHRQKVASVKADNVFCIGIRPS